MTKTDLNAVFSELKTIMSAHAKSRQVVHDTPEHYYLNEGALDAKGKPVFFGAVKIGSGKVAFHLMPVYCKPELLDGISPQLKARMQGKSCFNFSQSDLALLKELEALVKKSA
jgi:hypothetical protein